MVARSRGNTERRNWRNNSEQRAGRDSGGRGFYRSLFGGVVPSRRARRSGITALAALCGALAPLSLSPSLTAWANTPTLGNPQEITENFDAALQAFNAGKYFKALELSKTAAKLGSSDAAIMAGYILRYGKAGSTALRASRLWYEKAAAKGHPDAFIALGEMGIHGQAGLTKADAVSWLTRASDAGRTDAMRALADLYRTGQGVDANSDEAERLLKSASQSFDSEASKRLGDSLFERDPQAAPC